jgi:hypothetical protein
LNKYPNGLFVEVAQAKLHPKVEMGQVEQPSPDEQLLAQGQWRDPKTDLIWMRCSVGQTWLVKNCSGEAKKM